MPEKYLFVNIADFNLDVMENDSAALSMKAIVRRTYRKTPIFSARLTHLVFNPTWNIPSTILKNDALPLIKKDARYLSKKRIRIYKTEKDGSRIEIPPDSIDWKKISVNYFPYELIQDAGKDNALGVVKFMFPNPYNMYMHDTLAKELFNETEHTFSSGCIRISEAVKLAEHLIRKK